MNASQQYTEPWEGNIQKQLWHLRHEDPTQYQALVKMHLSFATDLPVDECDGQPMKQPSSGRKWQLTPLIRRLGRTSLLTKGVMEGAPLTQEGVCQVFQLIHFLNKEYNMNQEGLFRKSGSLSRQQELKNLLNSGRDLNLDSGSHSAHDCASVLKSFLADLPEPLLTEAHYPIHCKIAEMLQAYMCQEQKDLVYSRQIKALRLLFLLLPPENYQLLQDLLILLHRVSANKKQNLMSALNLGTMFAPHILCPRKMTANDLQYLSGTLSTAVAFMIDNAPHLFQIPLELEYDVVQYWSNKKKLKHQLSKRSLMDAPTNTIFTFIDRELTAQANDKDVTEVALAELYAYVQSLPDSAKKRRLIKKFNHASGLGTPQLNNSTVSKKQEPQGKKLGESIKKHLFYKTIIKSSKTKSTPISSFVSKVGVKRTNSEDMLSSPSKRSPELRRFQRNPDATPCDQLRTKSLDDLSSLISEYSSSNASSDELSVSSIRHPVFHPRSGYQFRGKNMLSVSIGLPHRHTSGSSSGSSCSLASPLPLTPLAMNSSVGSQYSRPSESRDFSYSALDSTVKEENSLAFSFTNSMLNETKENILPQDPLLHSTPAGPNIQVHSPISEAMLRASIPQKVIMTPRSRCPIIINSATNLANTAIPEERDSFICNTTLEFCSKSDDGSQREQLNSPIFSNPSAMLLSPEHKVESTSDSLYGTLQEVDRHSELNVDNPKLKEENSSDALQNNKRKLKKSSSFRRTLNSAASTGSSLRRTLSSASSTGSLFGSFFNHLSSSSLGQLATRLTSTASSVLINCPSEEEEDIKESPVPSPQKEDGDGELNESLSSVFREYLLSRSILTDNPVDLSTQFLEAETGDSSEQGPVKNTLKDEDSEDTSIASASLDSEHTHNRSQKSCLSESKACLTPDSESKVCLTPALESKACLTPASESIDSAVGLSPNASLSDSLLYCLDGNMPPNNADDKVHSKTYSVEQDVNNSHAGLHSCTPQSREQSLLKTKQGTPLPQRDKESTNSFISSKGVVFETSF